MTEIDAGFDEAFAWLIPPVLNEKTRLAMVADAKAGRLIARGYEATGPATEVFALDWHAAV